VGVDRFQGHGAARRLLADGGIGQGLGHGLASGRGERPAGKGVLGHGEPGRQGHAQPVGQLAQGGGHAGLGPFLQPQAAQRPGEPGVVRAGATGQDVLHGAGHLHEPVVERHLTVPGHGVQGINGLMGEIHHLPGRLLQKGPIEDVLAA